jgi:Haem-binding domain
MKRSIVSVVLGVLIVIQFIRPERNNSNDQTHHITQSIETPSEVATAIKVACYDCHSNNTNYTWPFKIQPFAWWMAGHVREGKEHLNFSDFGSLSKEQQTKAFKEIARVMEEKSMPIASYYWLGMHDGLVLTEAQQQAIINWAKSQALEPF